MTSEGTVELLDATGVADAPSDDPAALLARWRPGRGTWFSGPRGGLLAEGAVRRFGNPDDVGDVLDEVAASGSGPSLVVGALPFDPAGPAALVVPREVTWSPALGRTVEAPAAGRPSPHWGSRSLPEPAEYEAMVVEALRRMGAGDLEKVVLARVLDLQADGPVDQASMLRGLAARDPSGYVFAVDLADAGAPRTLLGASPELLISRRAGEVIANPLAGSAPRRRDPADDEATGAALLASAKDRHEHALVVTDVAGALAGVCDDLAVPAEPSLIRTDAMWHLSTTIRGRSSRSALDLARALHPTPAVGGVPREAAGRAITELEPFERGFYTGMVGWTDSSGDGEWVVALRCGEVCGASARLYAGAGLVPASVPSAELAETTAKLETMLASM
ncbi:isochorismate synthase [Actinomycetospora endophytica]|uniref:isochorismate synthase n=1 Tax=Actinomycetospora endophytica TaxID=2291215 RepID=A0ABS8P6P4_9PSEU|nr:isochorismate synthase [Actinomycetospora endophytica]MCD2193921.1 isochorismate synthase [Actinomycetospora endophytica]